MSGPISESHIFLHLMHEKARPQISFFCFRMHQLYTEFM